MRQFRTVPYGVVEKQYKSDIVAPEEMIEVPGFSGKYYLGKITDKIYRKCSRLNFDGSYSDTFDILSTKCDRKGISTIRLMKNNKLTLFYVAAIKELCYNYK